MARHGQGWGLTAGPEGRRRRSRLAQGCPEARRRQGAAAQQAALPGLRLGRARLAPGDARGLWRACEQGPGLLVAAQARACLHQGRTHHPSLYPDDANQTRGPTGSKRRRAAGQGQAGLGTCRKGPSALSIVATSTSLDLGLNLDLPVARPCTAERLSCGQVMHGQTCCRLELEPGQRSHTSAARTASRPHRAVPPHGRVLVVAALVCHGYFCLPWEHLRAPAGAARVASTAAWHHTLWQRCLLQPPAARCAMLRPTPAVPVVCSSDSGCAPGTEHVWGGIVRAVHADGPAGLIVGAEGGLWVGVPGAGGLLGPFPHPARRCPTQPPAGHAAAPHDASCAVQMLLQAAGDPVLAGACCTGLHTCTAAAQAGGVLCTWLSVGVSGASGAAQQRAALHAASWLLLPHWGPPVQGCCCALPQA